MGQLAMTSFYNLVLKWFSSSLFNFLNSFFGFEIGVRKRNWLILSPGAPRPAVSGVAPRYTTVSEFIEESVGVNILTRKPECVEHSSSFRNGPFPDPDQLSIKFSTLNLCFTSLVLNNNINCSIEYYQSPN